MRRQFCTKPISIRLSKDVMKKLNACAKSRDFTVSQMLRDILEKTPHGGNLEKIMKNTYSISRYVREALWDQKSQ